MKIISLSSNTAGPACAIATSVKKYFYNNNYQTNIFDFLELSLLSIIQILESNDIERDINTNHLITDNINNAKSVEFKNFDKIISHHDLSNNYSEDDFIKLLQKYKRRYDRFINDICTHNKIFFIRYGNDDYELIIKFINKIKAMNSKLDIKYINLIYDENSNMEVDNNNFILINFYNYIDKNKKYSDDLFFRIIEYNWKIIYDKINFKLNNNEKIDFNYYE
jgi:hypothetical protein